MCSAIGDADEMSHGDLLVVANLKVNNSLFLKNIELLASLETQTKRYCKLTAFCIKQAKTEIISICS